MIQTLNTLEKDCLLTLLILLHFQIEILKWLSDVGPGRVWWQTIQEDFICLTKF